MKINKNINVTVKYFVTVDCNARPIHPQTGVEFVRGCPAAVYYMGSPSKEYCLGSYTRGKLRTYKWWTTCCEWKNNKCQAKGKYLPIK